MGRSSTVSTSSRRTGSRGRGIRRSCKSMAGRSDSSAMSSWMSGSSSPRTVTSSSAATSGASISNILAGYGTDMYIREYEQELGVPWKNPEAWTRLSFPFLHADKIVTPTLFLGGDKDFNVPLLNSEQMYQALKSLGRDTQLIIYPGQFHGLSKPSYIKDRYERYLAWFGAHLK